ncbi:hypothetical protein D1122_14910 [Cereibacter sphaeroides]|uniref:hypothetical protein n=1 Tax=Cereibacter sphaeroides TaxID=1063 RepID=UPI000E5BFBC3|nr:hypothetical protein [Cereibacter sphaeroides]RHZ95340.1 hypothetical protein D1122_14910 [Cereibacter sphaeroides]
MLIDLKAARAARAKDLKPAEPRQSDEPGARSERVVVVPRAVTSFDSFVRWHPHLDPRLVAAEIRAAMKLDAATAAAMARDRRAAVRAALSALGLAEGRVRNLADEHWIATRIHSRAMRELERDEEEAREAAYRRALERARHEFALEVDARLAELFAAADGQVGASADRG